jgi:hypothetical protein
MLITMVMMGAAFLPAIAQGGAAAVSYVGVPPEVERVGVYRWRHGVAPAVVEARLDRAGSTWTVASAAGTDVIAVFVRGDGSYLVDGPFRWPSTSISRIVDRRWRRSVRVGMLDGTPREGDIEWIAAAGTRDMWPSCARDGPVAALCWGVPLDDHGIVYVQTPRQIWWAVVHAAAAGPMHVSEWGRLLVVRAGASMGLRAAIEYAVEPAQRARSVRLQTSKVPNSGGVPVGSGSVWVHGAAVPPRAWIDVRTARAGPAFLPLGEVAAGPPSLPVYVALDETRSLEGLVIDAAAAPAPGALATVFRLLAPPDRTPASGTEPPPRVFVAEAIADREGRFAIDGLGGADYEIVAWHPQRGRALVTLGARTRVEIRLESAGTIRGRALSAGTRRFDRRQRSHRAGRPLCRRRGARRRRRASHRRRSASNPADPAAARCRPLDRPGRRRARRRDRDHGVARRRSRLRSPCGRADRKVGAPARGRRSGRTGPVSHRDS